MTRLEKQLKFINELEHLKTIKRQNLTLDNRRQENSAEHSWHLAMMAMILSDSAEGHHMDQLKVIKMLLIHDLVEIYAGDAFLYDESARSEASHKEVLALKKLTEILPEDQGEAISAIWREFEEGTSDEARFANALDAFQPLMNHLLTAEANDNPHNIKAEKVYQKKGKIRDLAPRLWPAAEAIIQASIDKGLYAKD